LESDKQTELVENVQACNQALNNANALLDKYNGLSAQSKMTWDRLSWDQEGARDVETSLKQTIARLSAFYDSLKNSPQAKIEKALEQLADEISSGRHETGSVTSLSTASDYDDDSGWVQVIRDLGNLGIEENIASEYRSFIVDWILRAINSGVLSEKIPVEETPEQKIALPPPIPPKVPSPHSAAPLASPSAQYYPQQANSFNNIPNLRLAVSHDGFAHERHVSMDEPPSPIEPEPMESNIVWTAQRIVEAWGKREWSQVQNHIQQQINAVHRGEYVEIGGFPAQPDLRILSHLLGVSYSFSGDFLKAKEIFESVLQGVYVQGLPMDDGDIASARWLGETCIYLNQPLNAVLAWAIAHHGLLNKYPSHPQSNSFSYQMLEDLRFLNQRTNGLNALRNSVVKTNRDASTILPRMRGTDKFQIVLTAIESVAVFQMRTFSSARPSQAISIAEGFLIQPLVAQNSWPLPQDPFFETISSITLLSVLSRPKQDFAFNTVSTTSLGGSKHLTYVTKQPLKWLVEAVRFALNTYAIEWKVQGSMYLLRLSQTHERLAYYDCFGVRFRKLSFRSTYGIKITDPMYTTRVFNRNTLDLNVPAREKTDETQRKLTIRNELADRLKGYLEQAEKDVLAGKPWPPVDAPTVVGPYEMEGLAPSAYAELAGARPVAELPAEGRRKHRAGPPNTEIAELPAEPFR